MDDFPVAYPVGCVLGNAAAWGFIRKSAAFCTDKGIQHTNSMSQQRRLESKQQRQDVHRRAHFRLSGEAYFLWSSLSAVPAYICKFDFSEADGNADTAGNDHKRRQITDKENGRFTA